MEKAPRDSLPVFKCRQPTFVLKPKAARRTMVNDSNNNEAKALNVEGELSEEELGKIAMTKRDIFKAIHHFTNAIAEDPDKLSLFIDRCSCFMSLKRYYSAIADAQKAIKIDDRCVMSHCQLVECYLAMGDDFEAEKILKASKGARTKSKLDRLASIKHVRKIISGLIEKMDLEGCLFWLNNGLKLAQACDDFHFTKLRCLVILNRFEEVDESLTPPGMLDVLKNYYKGNINGSLNLLNMVNQKQKSFKSLEIFKKKLTQLVDEMAKASQLARENNFLGAIVVVERLLDSDPSNRHLGKLLFYNLAIFHYRSQVNYSNAIRCAMFALQIDPNFHKASVVKAKSYLKLNLYQNAKAECKIILNSTAPKDLKTIAENLMTAINHVAGFGADWFNAPSSESCYLKVEHESPKRSSCGRYSFNISFTKKDFKFEESRGANEELEENVEDKKLRMANEKYQLGCDAIEKKAFENAVELLTQAITLAPTETRFFNNRAACNFELKNYELAAADSLKVIEHAPGEWSGYSRAIESFLLLGNINQAENCLSKLQTNNFMMDFVAQNCIQDVNDLKDLDAKISAAYNDRAFDECLKNIEKALEIAKACSKYHNYKIESLIMLDKFEEAEKVMKVMLESQPENFEMFFFEGLKLYRQGEFTASIGKFELCLRIDPDLEKVQKFRRNAKAIAEFLLKAKNSENACEAGEHWQSILKFKDTLGKSIKNRAFHKLGVVNFHQQKFQEAIQNFNEALRLVEDDVQSLIDRAGAHYRLEEFEDALIDYEEALLLNPTDVNEKNVELTKTQISKMAKPDRLKILGVTLRSTKLEVKKAFHQLSLKFHSDKHHLATAIEKKKLDRKFLRITVAYNFMIKHARNS